MQFRLVMMCMAVIGFAVPGQAQQGDLVVQREAAGLFLNHEVAPKENFYSIGRLFNISPKVIAPYNGLALTGGLTIGQVIKIPLKDQNFTVVRKSTPGEVLVPIFRLDAGKKVAAGFLKVVKGQSSLADGGAAVPAPATASVKTSAGKSGAGVTAAPPATTARAPAVKTSATTGSATTPVGGSASSSAAAGPGSAPSGSAPSAATPAAAGTSDILAGPSAAGTTTPAVAPHKKPVKPKVVKPATDSSLPAAPAATPVTPTVLSAPATATSAATIGSHYFGEGFFHPDYLTQTDNGRKIHNASGLAGVFKSTSGWDNGKFYALMNNVERGTVIKVTNLSNNKVVFVKVLGDIADIRQNTGMVIVLSDAAVDQLGATTDRFTTELSYGK